MKTGKLDYSIFYLLIGLPLGNALAAIILNLPQIIFWIGYGLAKLAIWMFT